MRNNNNRKSGMISVELALGILFSVVVLFVAFGSINERLNDFAKSVQLTNVVNENSTKTSYTTYKRDYTNSTIKIK